MGSTFKLTSDLIDDLQTRGRYYFTRRQVREAFSGSDIAMKLSLNRLVKKKRISAIRDGLYIIIPLEYSASGILPAEWFIDDLMKHLDVPYYVGLLTAAAINGASHQQPQEFHVLSARPLRPIRKEGLRIRFFTKSGIVSAGSMRVKTQTGYMSVSNPAVTAFDLTAFSKQVGGLGRVFTIYQELGEAIDPDQLVDSAKQAARLAFVQRTGWLLARAEIKQKNFKHG
jgi:predicted transcriptional regulator of viral defense system